MCGIAGYIGGAVPEERVTETLRRMQNRGPDHQAAVKCSLGSRQVGLLSARLAILDLDERSNMPFRVSDYTIVFNGEIYNHVELRQELIKKGVVLRTSSDTEVLLHYYILYGEKCVDYFEGMWSFAIHDPIAGRLFLSRDRFGEKPLYYLEHNGTLYFGSEIKFLTALSEVGLEVNYTHLSRYLVNGYKALGKTNDQFYQNVRELPLAHNMVVQPDGKATLTRYWFPKLAISPMSLDDAREGVRERLIQSVKLRLRSDVPLAFCLSGGVDSNAIVAIAAKEFHCDVSTFSIIDPDPRYNEWENISATLADLKCKNTVIELKHDDFFRRLRTLIDYHDGPVSTITWYVHSYLTEAIAAQGFKVVLSGTAADELLTGYYDHFLLHLQAVSTLPDAQRWITEWETHLKPFVRNPFLSNPRLYIDNPHFRDHVYLEADTFRSYLTRDFNEAFFERDYWPGNLLRSRMLNELFEETIPIILHEDDLNSMLYSLENRSPYLDRELMEFCFSIPSEHLIREGYGKYLLREAVAGYVNDKVRLCRRKIGFNASVTSLIDLRDKNVRDYILSDSPVYNIVNRSMIEPLLQQDTFNDHFNKFLFSFLNAKMFLEMAS